MCLFCRPRWYFGCTRVALARMPVLLASTLEQHEAALHFYFYFSFWGYLALFPPVAL
jgi:hypothetical protein